LNYVFRVELCHAVGLLGFPCRGKRKNMCSIRHRGRDGSPSLPSRLVRSTDVVVVWARPPFIVSGASHDLDGKKAKMPSTPRINLSVDFKSSIWFSSVVQIAKCCMLILLFQPSVSWDRNFLPSLLILRLIMFHCL
jgi:hypothetical protein